VVAILLACGLSATGAMAQTLPQRQGLPEDFVLPGRATDPARASTGISPGAPADEALEVPDLRPAIPDDDPSADPIDPIFDETPRPRAGQRAVVVDGQIDQIEEQGLARDGVIEVGEPLPPEDGVDPLLIDTRPLEEAQLFQNAENPPAGFDPLLFQIEDIDPLRTDRRTRRLFQIEPYDPIGVRIGSFVYFPELEVSGFATSNVLRQSPSNSDAAAALQSRARLVSNWSAHALEFNATGLTSFYNEFASENDAAWNVEGRGRLDMTRRTNIQARLAHDVRQEGRFAVDANQIGDRTTLTTETAEATLNHQFNRLSVQLRGSFDDIDFGPATGTNVDEANTNDDRDTRVTEEAVRVTWEFKPTFSVFGEVETNQRRYDTPAQSDGLPRSSNGERYRVGVDFGETGQILRGEVSIGYGEQDPTSAGLSTVEGILVDASVAWRASDLTTLLFNARTDFFDTNTTGSAGVIARTVGVEARHAFRRHIVATAGLTYLDQNYDNVDIEESQLTAALGLEYFVNREWILFGRYEYFDFRSNQTGGDWTANDVRLGLRWRQ